MQPVAPEIRAEHKRVYEQKRYQALKDQPEFKQRRTKQYLKYADTVQGRATVLLNGAKYRAKKKNLECSLTYPWVVERLERGVCEMTGLPFVLEGKGKNNRPWSPSLDRIDNSKGYTPENTQVVVFLYNAAKNNATDTDVLMLAKALVRNAETH
jgi:hypothetical protein